MEEMKLKVPKRILGTLLNAYSAGVVPRTGLEYAAIGRNEEISMFLSDLEEVASGMGSFRFVIGKYGSGKSFLINLIRCNALERGFITADCDLSPERRFHGTKGQGLATFRELMKNISSKSSPDGGALSGILSKWLSDVQLKAVSSGFDSESREFCEYTEKEIYSVASSLTELVNGFDFAQVIKAFYEGSRGEGEESDRKKENALKWLRGEFNTRLEARSAGLGVSSIINDGNWYDFIKLYAAFFRKIGYKGFFVFFDECVNLYKIANRPSREGNYEKILSMFNDVLQGKASGVGIVMGGTPAFLEDNRRGLFSYEALSSRLRSGRFGEGYRNYSSPVIKLERLSDNELYALINRLYKLHNMYHGKDLGVTEAELVSFLKIMLGTVGADEMITPREIARDLLEILNIMLHTPGVTFTELLGENGEKLNRKRASDDTDGEDGSDDDGLFDFEDIDL